MTDPAASVVSEIRALVAADGGDVAVVESTETVLHLALDLPDEACRECVMPQAMLELVAADIATRHGVEASVTIDDPRTP